MNSKRAATAVRDAAERTAPEVLAEQEHLAADLQRLRDLLEESDVEGARAFVKELEQRWPESERVQHYARVLAPPRTYVIPGKRGRRLDREFAWLREHAREYRGQWVAIYEDCLIAADPDLSTVLASLRQTPGAEGALLHRIPKPQDQHPTCATIEETEAGRAGKLGTSTL